MTIGCAASRSAAFELVPGCRLPIQPTRSDSAGRPRSPLGSTVKGVKRPGPAPRAPKVASSWSKLRSRPEPLQFSANLWRRFAEKRAEAWTRAELAKRGRGSRCCTTPGSSVPCSCSSRRFFKTQDEMRIGVATWPRRSARFPGPDSVAATWRNEGGPDQLRGVARGHPSTTSAITRATAALHRRSSARLPIGSFSAAAAIVTRSL